MITERELDLAEMDADLELAELFAEFDEHYYGGRRGSNRRRDKSNGRNDSAEVNDFEDFGEGPDNY